MKKVYIIFLSILFFLSLNAQQNSEKFYYYYKGEKIFIQQRKDKVFLKFAATIDRKNLNMLIGVDTSLQLTSHVSLDNNLFCYTVLETKDGMDISLATFEFYNTQEEVVSINPLFEYCKELNGITDEFIVKLKPTTSIEQLQALVEKNYCKLLEENRFVKNQFKISVSKMSHLNALQTSVLFYETDFFEFSEPNFVILDAFQSNDPYFNQQWSLKLPHLIMAPKLFCYQVNKRFFL